MITMQKIQKKKYDHQDCARELALPKPLIKEKPPSLTLLKPFENTVIFCVAKLEPTAGGKKSIRFTAKNDGMEAWNDDAQRYDFSVSSRMLALGKLFE